MYFDYIREREPELQILERAEGFALYKAVDLDGERMVYIQDIYVKPEYRKKAIASEMSQEIQDKAKAEGIGYILGTVVPSAEGSTASIQVLLSHGMSLSHSTDDLIYFYKEL